MNSYSKGGLIGSLTKREFRPHQTRTHIEKSRHGLHLANANNRLPFLLICYAKYENRKVYITGLLLLVFCHFLNYFFRSRLAKI